MLVAGGTALVVESYAALVHSGGEVNDLLPAYLAVALFAGLAMDGHPGGLAGFGADRLARGRLATWRPGDGRPVGRRRGRRSGHRAAGRPGERLPSRPGDPGER